MSADYRELIEFQKKVEALAESRDPFIEAAAKEIAARLLSKVKKRTPVGVYSGESYTCATVGGKSHKGSKKKGRVGGNLRRNWVINPIRKQGNVYIVEIENPTKYAPYVEYGHRTSNHTGWVPGHFMMTISEKEIKAIAPRVLEAKLKKWLSEAVQ